MVSSVSSPTATGGTQFPLSALYAIAGAFGGVSPIRFIGRALWRALLEEIQRLG